MQDGLIVGPVAMGRVLQGLLRSWDPPLATVCCLGSNFAAISYQLCDLGQAACPHACFLQGTGSSSRGLSLRQL